MNLKIYVASSWRNAIQQSVVEILRTAGYEVYDFRNPRESDRGFHWSDIDPDWQQWSPEKYRDSLNHPISKLGFQTDMAAMLWADVFVGVMPFGRSASLEMGWAAGQGKKTILLLENGEPELMVKMLDHICCDMSEVLQAILKIEGACIKCGCTDEDCSQCIEAQGEPCYWAQPGKCSRCFDANGLLKVSEVKE